MKKLKFDTGYDVKNNSNDVVLVRLRVTWNQQVIEQSIDANSDLTLKQRFQLLLHKFQTDLDSIIRNHPDIVNYKFSNDAFYNAMFHSGYGFDSIVQESSLFALNASSISYLMTRFMKSETGRNVYNKLFPVQKEYRETGRTIVNKQGRATQERVLVSGDQRGRPTKLGKFKLRAMKRNVLDTRYAWPTAVSMVSLSSGALLSSYFTGTPQTHALLYFIATIGLPFMEFIVNPLSEPSTLIFHWFLALFHYMYNYMRFMVQSVALLDWSELMVFYENLPALIRYPVASMHYVMGSYIGQETVGVGRAATLYNKYVLLKALLESNPENIWTYVKNRPAIVEGHTFKLTPRALGGEASYLEDVTKRDVIDTAVTAGAGFLAFASTSGGAAIIGTVGVVTVAGIYAGSNVVIQLLVTATPFLDSLMPLIAAVVQPLWAVVASSILITAASLYNWLTYEQKNTKKRDETSSADKELEASDKALILKILLANFYEIATNGTSADVTKLVSIIHSFKDKLITYASQTCDNIAGLIYVVRSIIHVADTRMEKEAERRREMAQKTEHDMYRYASELIYEHLKERITTGSEFYEKHSSTDSEIVLVKRSDKAGQHATWQSQKGNVVAAFAGAVLSVDSNIQPSASNSDDINIIEITQTDSGKYALRRVVYWDDPPTPLFYVPSSGPEGEVYYQLYKPKDNYIGKQNFRVGDYELYKQFAERDLLYYSSHLDLPMYGYIPLNMLERRLEKGSNVFDYLSVKYEYRGRTQTTQTVKSTKTEQKRSIQPRIGKRLL